MGAGESVQQVHLKLIEMCEKNGAISKAMRPLLSGLHSEGYSWVDGVARMERVREEIGLPPAENWEGLENAALM